MSDHRTRGQRWADKVTEFSGSWTFIIWFVIVCLVWIVVNSINGYKFDPYPFLFLNWTLTVVSTFQNPLILLSQNRQNENDQTKTDAMLDELKQLRRLVEELRNR